MALLRRTIWTLSVVSMLSLPVFLTGCQGNTQTTTEPSATATEEPAPAEGQQAEPSGEEAASSEAGSTTGGGTETP